MKQTKMTTSIGEDVRARRGQDAGRDEQRVTGQEEAEEEARLGEDDGRQADDADGQEQLLEVDPGKHRRGVHAVRRSGGWWSTARRAV